MPHIIYNANKLVYCNSELWWYLCILLILSLKILAGRIKRKKDYETSPERVARFKKEREYNNRCIANKLKNINLIPSPSKLDKNIEKDLHHTNKRSHKDDSMNNTPVSKRGKFDIISEQKNRRASETPEQRMLNNSSRRNINQNIEEKETKEEKQTRLQEYNEYKKRYRNNKETNQKIEIENFRKSINELIDQVC
jgi:hypothetical protein